MKKQLMLVVMALLVTVASSVFAQDKVQPVRMGSGSLQFETVPGWGYVPMVAQP